MPQMPSYSRRRDSHEQPQTFFPRRGDSASEIARKIVFMVSSIVLVVVVFILLDYYVFHYFGFFDRDSGPAAPELRQVDMQDTRTNTIQLPPAAPGEEVVEVSVLERYLKFYEANNDFVGYVTMGDEISEPVTWLEQDNDFYLNHNFDKIAVQRGMIYADGWGRYGAPSPDNRGRPDNVILHGHNLKSEVLFHALRGFVKNDDSAFEFLKENPLIQFDTLFEEGFYKIFAVGQINVDELRGEVYDYWRKNYFSTEDEFYQYVVEMLDRSRFHTDVDLQYGDELITLSTCCQDLFNPSVRIFVVARRIREGESILVDTDKFEDLTVPNTKGRRGRDEDGWMNYMMFDAYYRSHNGYNGWRGRDRRKWDTGRIDGVDAFFTRHPSYLGFPEPPPDDTEETDTDTDTIPPGD